MKNILKLIGSIAICQSAGIIGSFFTSSVKTWYPLLQKPYFNPPSWVFMPVWLVLYTLMGISSYLILISPIQRNIKLSALSIFIIQLILNATWSIVFFGLKSILGGFIIICLLSVFVLLSFIAFYRINKTASLLLIPYLLWLSFAAVLNYKILVLN